jgi:hypothetical protein
MGGSGGSGGGGAAGAPVCDPGYQDGDKNPDNGCTPVPVEGMKFWYAADDLDRDTALVALWPDRSGAGRDAVQPDEALRPTRVADGLAGRAVVRFDGAHYLTLPSGFDDLGEGITFVVVALREADAISFAMLLDLKNVATGNGRFFGRAGTTDLFVYGLANQGVLETTEGLYVSDVYHLVSVVHQSDATASIRFCGDDVAVSAPGLPLPEEYVHDTNSLGSNRATDPLAYHKGTIAEMLFYRRALAPSDLALAESYLSAKWQLCR